MLDRAVGARVLLLPPLSYKGEGVPMGLGEKLVQYQEFLK